MNCRLDWVHWGTGAMAPPGALSVTPTSPSGVGPLDDQLYCRPCTCKFRSQTPPDRRQHRLSIEGKARGHALLCG